MTGSKNGSQCLTDRCWTTVWSHSAQILRKLTCAGNGSLLNKRNDEFDLDILIHNTARDCSDSSSRSLEQVLKSRALLMGNIQLEKYRRLVKG